MLGFSITKLLFTAGIIIAVWRGFKMLESFRNRVESQPAEAAGGKPKPQSSDEVEMIECPRCGTFMPKGQFCTCSGKS